jgi:hypothetical protein
MIYEASGPIPCSHDPAPVVEKSLPKRFWDARREVADDYVRNVPPSALCLRQTPVESQVRTDAAYVTALIRYLLSNIYGGINLLLEYRYILYPTDHPIFKEQAYITVKSNPPTVNISGLWNMFTRHRVIRPAADGPSPPEPQREPEREPTQYHPTVEDVLQAKSILLAIASFPLELVDTIIDVAEYWPCSTTLNTGRYRIRDVSWGPHGSGDHFLVSQVIPQL